MKDIHFDGTARDLPLMDPPAVIYVRGLKRGIDIVICHIPDGSMAVS
jgi:hypothetical protein